MKWIQCRDKMPPFMRTVLLAYPLGVTVGWLESEDVEDPVFFSCEHRQWMETVYAWMDLPKAPKKEINEH